MNLPSPLARRKKRGGGGAHKRESCWLLVFSIFQEEEGREPDFVSSPESHSCDAPPECLVSPTPPLRGGEKCLPPLSVREEEEGLFAAAEFLVLTPDLRCINPLTPPPPLPPISPPPLFSSQPRLIFCAASKAKPARNANQHGSQKKKSPAK